MNIFACDDEHFALMLLCKAIREAEPDATLREFRNPGDLLAAAAETPCDVAFLDIEMPKMNGLEVAAELKKLYPRVNIVFVSGHEEHAMAAWEMMASGFILKPARCEKIREQLDNLRYEVSRLPDVVVQTFGNFDIFVRGKSVHFRRGKSKEMIAYLVDRRGAAVSRKEIYEVLFGSEEFNRSRQNYLSIIAHDTEADLEAAGAAGLFRRLPSSYCVDTRIFYCDAYELMRGDAAVASYYKGEYMKQYKWAKYFKA